MASDAGRVGTKPLRAMLLTETFPPVVGGVETFLQSICGFSRTEFEVLTGSTAGCAEFDTTQSYRIRRLTWHRGVGLASYFAAAASMFGKGRFDAVFVGYFSPVIWVGLFLKALFSVPLLVLVHGRDLEYFLASEAGSRAAYAWALRRCDFVWTNCQYNRDRYAALGLPPARTGVLNPGVDTSVFRSQPPSPIAIESYGLAGKRILLTVGRLVEKKNHAMVIRALPALLTEVPNLVYLIVGDGPERERLAALARDLGVESKVIFAGVQRGDALVDVYNVCDVFVMPSKAVGTHSTATDGWGNDTETFGIAFVEASACGKPVVGGNTGGVPDAIADGETGYLVDPKSIEQLTAVLLGLLEDPAKAEEMGRRGRARAEERFAWDRVVARFDVGLEMLVGVRR